MMQVSTDPLTPSTSWCKCRMWQIVFFLKQHCLPSHTFSLQHVFDYFFIELWGVYLLSLNMDKLKTEAGHTWCCGGVQGKVTCTGLPWNGCLWNTVITSRGSPGSPWTSTQEESELPGEASSYLAVMCVIILKADLWALSESAPADARLSRNNNFCLTQPKLQLLNKINNCRVLSHYVLECFAMQG